MRAFLPVLLLSMVALVLAAIPAGGQDAGKVDRPNIVVILIDDLRWDDIGCAGHPFVKTPNIDRIAREGVRCRNFFTTTPLCSPSRASFLTGQYAHTHKVLDNRDNVARSMKLTTFPSLLQRLVGYLTAFIGKWHMGTSDQPRPGFDHWVSFPFDPFPGKKSSGYIDPELNVNGKRQVVKGYMTDILTDQAVRFIKEAKKKPFLVYLAHKAVHPEITVPFEEAGSFVPAQRHKNLYADQTIPRAPSAKQKPQGKPALARKVEGQPPFGPATGTSDETIRNRLRMMAAVDEGIGKLFQTLEETKQLDNTIIVFTSDNGYFYGEHGLSDERRLAYEESIRLPLLVRYPPLIKAGTTLDPLTLNIDLAPTMLEMAGVAIPKDMEGRSLVPLFKGGETNWRKSFLVEYFTDKVRVRIPNMGYQAVRTDSWTYIRYTDLKDMDELYNLQNDPYQLTNLIQQPKAQVVLRQIQLELARLLKESQADDQSPPNARLAVEGYVAAALAGKIEDAVALAVEGQGPAKIARIKEFQALLGVKTLKAATVLVSDKKGQAIAVSEPVKLTKANPDGRDNGRLIFAVVKDGGKWLVRDIDFRTEEEAKEKLKGFEKKNPDSKEIPAKAAK